MGGGAAPTEETKTVIVLGAAYGGARAAQLLAAELPKEWRLILIDRNSHMNHVYVMPRFAVLPGHEYKAFIPLTNVFRDEPPNPKHITLQAHVTSIRPSCISITHHDLTKETIPFDYLIYALGSHLPAPLDLWGSSSSSSSSSSIDEARKIKVLNPMTPTGVKYNGLKVEGIEWMKEKQRIVEEAPSVLVVGGGALGIQFATDIKSVYPSKQVSLLHSRKQVLPRFDVEMHLEVIKSMNELNIDVILGERLDLDSIPSSKVDSTTTKPTIVRTVTGREISADLLLLCTGQVPNTSMLRIMDPGVINPDNKLARVLKTMQLSRFSTSKPHNDESDLEEVFKGKIKISTNDYNPAKDVEVPEEETVDLEKHTPYPHIFVTGDAADAFGAIPAGHNAYAQTEVAARNIIRLINSGPKEILELERYTPKPPAIKVSLGLNKFVYQTGDKVGTMVGDNADLNVASMWPLFGITVEKDEDMRA